MRIINAANHIRNTSKMTTASATIELAQALIRKASITPEDNGCQILLKERLEKIGFYFEALRFGEVDNFWAVKGESGPILAFAGHTDVVPTGKESDWKYPPFSATLEEDRLYGRGAADMKGSIAAFVTACERLLAQNPALTGRIALLITSDEEGPAHHGTKKVIELLEQHGEKITWCLIGEPSSEKKLGDVVKNGRRGSLHGNLTVLGIQGHVAYPQRADNPIHKALPALTELSTECWDQGNKYFPATSFQITNISSGTGASNVIPGEKTVVFNFRFSTELTEDDIKNRTHKILDRHALNYQLNWELSGQPFLTEKGPLVSAATSAIKKVMGKEPELSTSGGTSDGRFIAPTGAQILELGPINTSIHKVNEYVSINDLNQLSTIYEYIINTLICQATA